MLACRCCATVGFLALSGCPCSEEQLALLAQWLQQEGTSEPGFVMGAAGILLEACGVAPPPCMVNAG